MPRVKKAGKKQYKVWIEIEEIDAEGSGTGLNGEDFGVLPDPLGTYDTIEEATARVWEIVKDNCADDADHSDAKPGNICPICRSSIVKAGERAGLCCNEDCANSKGKK